LLEIKARVRSINNEISDFSVSTSNIQKARRVKMWKKTGVFFDTGFNLFKCASFTSRLCSMLGKDAENETEKSKHNFFVNWSSLDHLKMSSAAPKGSVLMLRFGGLRHSYKARSPFEICEMHFI